MLPSGEWVIPLAYSAIRPLGPYLHLTDSEGQEGLLDSSYETVLTTAYSAIRLLAGRFLTARYQGQWHFFTPEGLPLPQHERRQLPPFSQGAHITIENGEIGIAYPDGYVQIEAPQRLPQGHLLGTKCGYWGIEDEARRELLPFEYVGITYLPHLGLFLLERNPHRFGLMDEDYRLLLPCAYDQLLPEGESAWRAHDRHGWHTFPTDALRAGKD